VADRADGTLVLGGGAEALSPPSPFERCWKTTLGPPSHWWAETMRSLKSARDFRRQAEHRRRAKLAPPVAHPDASPRFSAGRVDWLLGTSPVPASRPPGSLTNRYNRRHGLKSVEAKEFSTDVSDSSHFAEPRLPDQITLDTPAPADYHLSCDATRFDALLRGVATNALRVIQP
jgi:hypothetical protein